MRAVWATDIHLNFLGVQERADFFRAIVEREPDTVCITGDIAEGPSLLFHLQEMQRALDRPVYFVLGNHDFYFSSFDSVREQLDAAINTHPSLIYLSPAEPVVLTSRTVLIGVDGWGDGRYGNFWRSPVRLNDQECIGDFHGLNREALLRKLQALGDEEAERLRTKLLLAVAAYPHVLVLTHVPPFKEACWYEGRMGNDDWLPYFTCKAVGDVLREAALRHPQCEITVLCGHTHHAGTIQVLPNLSVLTGAAEYGRPSVEQVLPIR